MPTAALYCRISADSAKRGEGVENQRARCRELAARLGYEVTTEFIENDVSASTNSRRPRPIYSDMLDRARRGEFSALIAYSTSRLTRRPREFEDLIDLVQAQGVKIHTANAGDMNLTTASGRDSARYMAHRDAAEPDFISERVQLAARGRAERGKAHGRYAYGWNRSEGIDVVNEDEAGVLREAAQRVLAGESLRAVAGDFDRRGITTPRAATIAKQRAANPTAPTKQWEDKPWDGLKVRKLLLRQQNAGAITVSFKDATSASKRSDVTYRSGQAIWDEGYQARLDALLQDPSRRTVRGRELRHLMSGLLRCGDHQEHRLKGRVGGLYKRASQPEGARRASFYACPECAGVRGPMEDIDLQVQALVLARLMQADGPDLLSRDEDVSRSAREDAEQARARLNSAADKWAAGVIDDEQLERISVAMREKIAASERIVAQNAPSPAIAEFSTAAHEASVAEAWDAQSLEVRRAVIDQIATFSLTPAPRRGAPWDRDRLRVEWRRAGAPTVR